MITIALDAMGGDDAPNIVIEGAAIALKKIPDLQFIIYGNESEVLPLLEASPQVKSASIFHHTPYKIAPQEKPSIALRRGKKSSMRLAIDAVKRGDASGIVSAGNTGALMATAKVILRMLPGISRPAIAGLVPNSHHDALMLDLGANLECRPRELVEFAVMGDAFARLMMSKSNPRITLLNIGTEEMKGHEEIREAAARIKAIKSLNFYGFAEGDDILNSKIDVVVCDGFTGNISIKTMEGTARYIYNEMSKALKSSILSKSGALLALPALKRLKKRMDPRRYNGAMFLGLNGVVVKSHGGTDAYGFYHAIKEAYGLIHHDINKKIVEELHEGGLINGNSNTNQLESNNKIKESQPCEAS